MSGQVFLDVFYHVIPSTNSLYLLLLFSLSLLSDLDQNDGVDLGIVPVALDELHSDLASTDLALLALE